MSVIINLGKYNRSGHGVLWQSKTEKLGKKDHVQKYLHSTIIMGPFEIFFLKDSLRRDHRTAIFFILTKNCTCNSSWGYVL